MSNVLDIIVRATDQASAVLTQVGEAGGGAASLVKDNWLAATVALAGAGAAIEGLARSQQQTTVATRHLAARIGESEDAVRGWATELTGAGDPLDEMVGLMDLASRAGLEGQAALQGYATFWDNLGDATGEAAPALAQAGIGLRGIGIAAGEEAAALDAFGFIMDKTGQGVGDFLAFVERTGPDLRAMGVDVNDAAAIFGVLERELGLTGRVARSQFNEAIAASDGTLTGMLATLGISEAQFATYRDAVDGAGAAVERNAAITNAAFTPLQHLEAQVADLAFGFGGLVNQAAGLAPVLMAVGPVVAGLKGGLTALKAVKMTLVTTVLPQLNIALKFLAANPIGLVITAIGLLVAAFVWLMQNNEQFRAVVMAVWEAVVGIIGGAADAIGNVFRSLAGIVSGIWEGMVGAIRTSFNFMIGLVNRVIGFLNGLRINVPAIDLPIIGRVGGFSVGMPQIPRIPTLHTGAWRIPDEMLAILGRGEMVLPAGPAAMLRATATAGPRFGGPLVHIEHFSGSETESERLALLIARRVGRR